MQFNIKEGLDIPIAGEPEQKIGEGNKVKSVAILGVDYVGMKPTMNVKGRRYCQAGPSSI